MILFFLFYKMYHKMYHLSIIEEFVIKPSFMHHIIHINKSQIHCPFLCPQSGQPLPTPWGINAQAVGIGEKCIHDTFNDTSMILIKADKNSKFLYFTDCQFVKTPHFQDNDTLILFSEKKFYTYNLSPKFGCYILIQRRQRGRIESEMPLYNKVGNKGYNKKTETSISIDTL